MSYQPSHRSAATMHQPAQDPAEIESLLIDDEFDHFLDREISVIRESLDDFRNS